MNNGKTKTLGNVMPSIYIQQTHTPHESHAFPIKKNKTKGGNEDWNLLEKYYR